jgi:hypothetical protein
MVDTSPVPASGLEEPAKDAALSSVPVESAEPAPQDEQAPPEPVLSLAPERLLAHELDAKFLGTKVHANLYLTNAFRLLAMPAITSGRDLEPRIQRLRQMSRLSPARALKSAASVGYEQHGKIGDPAASVSRLSDPRVRIFHEIFWPHLGPDQGTWPAPAELAKIANAGDHGPDSAVVGQHALAIAHHNQAIAHEIEVAYGRANWSDGHWLRAHIFWQGLVSNERFWTYVSRRVKDFDDPRLREADVDRIRAALPGIVLSFNGLFTRLYANAGNGPLTAAHVRLIQNSPFAEPERLATLNTAVEDLARFRVGPWTHQVEQVINAVDKKYQRKEFNARFGPMVNGVSELEAWLSGGLGLDLSGLELGCFDEFVLAARDAINNHIDYNGSDNRRSVLYSSLVIKRLLGFPVTTATRHKLDEVLASDRRILYRRHLGADDHDPTMCFFMPGQAADPDASILEPMYKVTRRTVKVDRIAETAGISLGYDVFRVLVPRSRAAAEVHRETSQNRGNLDSDDSGDGEDEVSNGCMLVGCGSSLAVGAVILFCMGLPGWGALTLLPTLVVFIAAGVSHLLDGRRKRLEAAEEERLEAELAAQRAEEAAKHKALPPAPPKPKVRKLKMAGQFPVFRAAKSDGYKRGSEPPDSEMRMTDSEREDARMKLLMSGW